MANQSGTRGAGIAKGGYKPKPFRNETGMQRLIVLVPHKTFTRIKDIAVRESSTIETVAGYAIEEYFRIGDWKPYANDIGGTKMYIAGRQLDTTKPLHSGNVEYCGEYVEDRTAVMELCAELNQICETSGTEETRYENR